MMEAPKVPFTLIPVSFLPAIGLVMVRHAEMDEALNTAICHVAGIDRSAGISFLTKTQNTSARADILRNLATTKLLDDSQAIKAHVLADLIVSLSGERNIIAHSVPYWGNARGDEVGYFRDVVKTFPQIKRQPPYVATFQSLTELAERMNRVSIWLGLMLPRWQANEGDTPGPHPDWAKPDSFGWPELYAKKVASWNRVTRIAPPGDDVP